MPSIALFIRELLAEEKYSTDFINRIEDRIKDLNAAQLQGMYNHLKTMEHTAKSGIWKNANQEIMSKIEGILKIRVEEAQKEKKVIEEYYIKQRQKQQMKKIAAKEKIRVMEMIEQNAFTEAEKEIKDNELKRQAAERVYILQEIGKAEEKRNFWWKILLAFYICALGGISYVMRESIIILIPCVFGLTVISVYLAYRAHLWTEIKPIVITPEQLDALIELKAEILRKQALSNIRERERKFQEQQRRDTIERRRLRAQRKEQQRLEIEMFEKERLERIQQARLLLAKSMKEESKSAPAKKNVIESVDIIQPLVVEERYPPTALEKSERHIRFQDPETEDEAGMGFILDDHEENEGGGEMWKLKEYSSSEEFADDQVELFATHNNQISRDEDRVAEEKMSRIFPLSHSEEIV